ncbi:MAG: hypothetical protein WDN04_20420 [Rhodospirillales bacterium]
MLVRDVKDMQAGLVSDTELTRAKAQMLRRLPMQRASIDCDRGAVFAAEWIWACRWIRRKSARNGFSAATAPDIQNAFRSFLRPDDLAQIVKGPPTTR